MPVDIEMIHDVALGKLQGRGCGKTYLACQNVCGYIELGKETIIALVRYMRDAHFIMPMLLEVMHEHEIKVTSASFSLIKGDGFQVLFVPKQSFDERVQGVDGVLVDFIDH